MSNKGGIKYDLEGIDGSVAILTIKYAAKKANIIINYKNSESLNFKINNYDKLYKCLTILRFIAELSPSSQLYGSTLYHEAVVNQYLDLFWNDLELPLYTNNNNILVNSVSNKVLNLINDILMDNTYLVSSNITAADIYLFSIIKFAKENDIDLKSKYQNISRWFNTLENVL
jgi:hypothetical protein